ncbi:MAG: hypothetical protein KCHDKBKB_00874 [Elusimicrobia bacterium]|nr:hypothetical protein [Elusimicrobiota bacterium]
MNWKTVGFFCALIFAIPTVKFFLASPSLPNSYLVSRSLLALVCLVSLLVSKRNDSEYEILPALIKTRTIRILFIVLTLILGSALSISPGFAYDMGLLIFTLLWVVLASSSSMTIVKDRLKISGVFLVSLVGSMLLAEGALRIFEPDKSIVLKQPAHPNYDKENFRIWGKFKFRSFRWMEPQGKGPRILVLGDSFSWGDKIQNTKDIWPYFMESLLREDKPGTEVVNLSLRGNTFLNNLEFLRRLGWGMKPDVVIVQYFLNDPLPSGPNFEHAGGSWMQEEVPSLYFSSDTHDKLLSTSVFYHLVNKRWERMLRKILGLRDLSIEDLHKEGFAPWEETKVGIAEMKRECEEREKPLLFVLFPFFLKDGRLDQYPFSDIHEKIRTVVQSNDIEFIDLYPVFRELDPHSNTWRVLRDDGHPSIAAHRQAGITVAAKIRKIVD